MSALSSLSTRRLLDGLDGPAARHDAVVRGVSDGQFAVAVFCNAVAAVLRVADFEAGDIFTGADAFRAVDELQRRAELVVHEAPSFVQGDVLGGLRSLASGARAALGLLGRDR